MGYTPDRSIRALAHHRTRRELPRPVQPHVVDPCPGKPHEKPLLMPPNNADISRYFRLHTAADHAVLKQRALALHGEAEFPPEFDWRKKAPELISQSLNQGHCGSCWCVSTTTVLHDMYNLATGAKQSPGPSYSAALSLATQGRLPDCHGCQGGFPSRYIEWLQDNKLPDERCASADWCGDSCDEHNVPRVQSLDQCYTCSGASCSVGGDKPSARFGAKPGEQFVYHLADPEHIKAHLMHHGPVCMGYVVYDDFMQFQKTEYWKKTNHIYIHGSYEDEVPGGADRATGGHAVVCIGWGTDPQFGQYWIIRNSWGPEWGADRDGCFKAGMSPHNANVGFDRFTRDWGDKGGAVGFVADVEGSDGAVHPDSLAGAGRSQYVMWLAIALLVAVVAYFLLARGAARRT